MVLFAGTAYFTVRGDPVKPYRYTGKHKVLIIDHINTFPPPQPQRTTLFTPFSRVSPLSSPPYTLRAFLAIAQRVIIAGPLAIGPRLRTPRCRCPCRCTLLLALLLRRVALSSLEHGRSRRGHVLLGVHVAETSACTFCLHFPLFPTLPPPPIAPLLSLFTSRTPPNVLVIYWV